MKLTKTKLQQLIQEELAKITEGMPPGLGDAPGDPEPDYSGEPEMSAGEEALVAASQMLDALGSGECPLEAFQSGNFEVSIEDAVQAMPQARSDREARAQSDREARAQS